MKQRIGEGEMGVMEVLWSSNDTLTAAEIVARTARDWSESTVKTMLSRLVAKGVVSHEARGRAFFYRAAVQRGAYASTESRRLLDRLFKGRVAPLVAHLAQTDSLSAEDIAELEALLKDLQR
ncbi:MAG: BlaI/MecI/CopY family transcriptional regulator [Janthinobacterium lividum]